jgi:hypothetical protein
LTFAGLYGILETGNNGALMFYSEMAELPLQTRFYRDRGVTAPRPKNAVEELMNHVHMTGWGHIPVYEYPCFEDIIQDFRGDRITYEQFLDDIVETCREIYNDPDYDGDESMHQFHAILAEAAARRGQAGRFDV